MLSPAVRVPGDLSAVDARPEEDAVIAGAKILVADDEVNIRTTISDILRKYKAEVTMASNGGEAVALIEKGQLFKFFYPQGIGCLITDIGK